MLNDIGVSFESGISVTEARLILRKWQKKAYSAGDSTARC